jgi:bifunctional DNA-binding transcriptional regulator/antitoxin component of YhaV-PrlF toxin-antitoxin module
MTVDAANIYPGRVLSYEFEPSEEGADLYVEKEPDYQGGEWTVSQVRFFAAHSYQADIYLFHGETAEPPEPWQEPPSPGSGVVWIRVTDDGHVVVSADAVRALGLSPGDEVEVQIRGPRVRRSLRGLVAGRSNVSEEDLAEVRSEMWKNFPRTRPR